MWFVLMFGTLVAANVKGRDTPARYGGEEFSIIMPGISASQAKHGAESIRQAIEQAVFPLTNQKQPYKRSFPCLNQITNNNHNMCRLFI